MQNKPYKIIMSRGDNIQIDADELPNILKGIVGKNPVMVRRGIINPSFYVSIVKDEERWRNHLENIKYMSNEEKLLLEGVPQLKDMFKDTVLKLKA
jgi:hypothetical protein